MSLKQIPNLPPVISLNGTEEMEAVQAGVSVKVTSAQIAGLTNGAGVVLINTTAPVTGGPITASGTIGLDLPSDDTLYLNGDGLWTSPPGTGGITDLTGDVVGTGPGSVATTIQDGVVDNAKLADMLTDRFKGRTTAGSGPPEDLTGTEATALLDEFTSALQGVAPASGGGTVNYLRADGTWAEPPGASGGGAVGRPWVTVDTGEDMMTCVTAATTTTATSAAGRMSLFPFLAPADITFASLKCSVITTGAGNIKMGYYTSDADGRPDAHMGETADISMGSTGFFSAALSGTLLKGYTYWFYARFSGVSGTYRTWAAGAVVPINGGTTSGASQVSVQRTVTYGNAAPDPWVWNSAEISATSPPAIYLVQ